MRSVAGCSPGSHRETLGKPSGSSREVCGKKMSSCHDIAREAIVKPSGSPREALGKLSGSPREALGKPSGHPSPDKDTSRKSLRSRPSNDHRDAHFHLLDHHHRHILSNRYKLHQQRTSSTWVTESRDKLGEYDVPTPGHNALSPGLVIKRGKCSRNLQDHLPHKVLDLLDHHHRHILSNGYKLHQQRTTWGGKHLCLGQVVAEDVAGRG